MTPLLNRCVVLPFLRLLNRLASDTAARLGGGLGLIAWRLGVRRRMAQQIVTETLGLKGWARQRVVRRSYATMGATFLDLFTVGGVWGVERQIRYLNPHWQALMHRRHPGAVHLAAHIGSWDMAAAGQRRFCPRLLAYAKAQHNPEVDAYVNELRRRAGFETLFAMNGDRTAAVTVVRGLRNGVPLGLMADQRPWAEHGEKGFFLGLATWCLPGSGFFAERCQVPMIPGFCIRVSATELVMFTGRPIAPCGDAVRSMQTGLDMLSAFIAAFPGQYFWQHNRFKVRVDVPPRPHEPWRERGLSLLVKNCP